ncbi:atrial natriuretic peptide receptor 1-like isoform X2 [Pomacea canaliculata]|uniref:atrial natriuretic peptide receptor 1-like isoform X2 n=1 Tax=Pomacea canaliculata TaxID=400727 RepID=UPI000D73820A|nr:atrial natriuretic peptide receptor 1-like isoform X2 [Pomacea canaliculata]
MVAVISPVSAVVFSSVLLSSCAATVITRKEFRIAWLAPKEMHGGFSAGTSVSALKLALRAIEAQHLRGSKLRVKWYDSKCEPKAAITAAVDARSDFDPDLFLGPPCSPGMSGVAMLASHWNIPVFGWVSNDHELKYRHIYSTLVRVLGPLNQFSKTMMYVKILFRWDRFAMIFDEDSTYRTVHSAIVAYLRERNNTITSAHGVNIDKSDSEVQDIFMQVRKYARVIILSVPWLSMRKYMLVAHQLNMTSGDFAFICINSDVYTRKELQEDVLSDKVWHRNDTFDDDARAAFESVIYVMMAPAEEEVYNKFETLVSRAEDLNYSRWELPTGNNTLDAYAPFLYDATLLWAILVNQTMAADVDPRNGSYIFQRAQAASTKGVTGLLALDMDCDRLFNMWLLDMQADGRFKEFVKIDNTVDGGYMARVTNIRWPDGREGDSQAPPDTPDCGFEGELCKKEPVEKPADESYTDSIIGAAAGSSVVLAIAIAVQVLLRRCRRRKKMKSLIWQVKFEEIDFVTAFLCGSVRSSFRNLGRRKQTGSKKLQKSNSDINLTGSSDSPRSHHLLEGGATMFGSVAYLRGSLVSVKRMNRSSVGLTKDMLEQFNRLMELKHQNVTAFVGACVDPSRILLLWEYCAKGSLQDVIWNTNIKLDQLFKFALCQDVAKGLEYLHKTHINYHGNLKSSNCVVDSRWTCKLTDFGLPKLRAYDKGSVSAEDNWDKELWTAPEVLKGETGVDLQKADIYALGIILKEVFTRSGPYSDYSFMSSAEIIQKVKNPNPTPFRPTLARDIRHDSELTSLISDCWAEDPAMRPTPARVLKTLNKLNPSKHMTVIDNMVAMLEKYANHLEELVAERTSELDAEKRKTENLLYRMLPQSVAEDLKSGKPVKAELFDEVTIYFSDIVGFTKICADSTPIEVVNLLNSLYTLFDDIITAYDVYKVETIGDAYMLASGLPKRNGERHIKEIADCSMDILASIGTFRIPHLPERQLMIRIGIHTGAVVAGVVGLAMPRYCLFGDAVNTASRMESTGVAMKIHLSSQARDKLINYHGYHIVPRGEISVKGKGTLSTYFCWGRDDYHKHVPDATDYHHGSSDTKLPGGQPSVFPSTVAVQSETDSHAKQRHGFPGGGSHPCNSSVGEVSQPVRTSSVTSSQDDASELQDVDVKLLRKNFEPTSRVQSEPYTHTDRACRS